MRKKLRKRIRGLLRKLALKFNAYPSIVIARWRRYFTRLLDISMVRTVKKWAPYFADAIFEPSPFFKIYKERKSKAVSQTDIDFQQVQKSKKL